MLRQRVSTPSLCQFGRACIKMTNALFWVKNDLSFLDSLVNATRKQLEYQEPIKCICS